MAMVQRLLSATFTLGSGTFTGTSSNTVSVSGLRASVKCVKAGGDSMGALQMQIYGLTLSMMQDLSTLGQKIQLVGRNKVVVQAGDADSGMSIFYQGNITNCWADFQRAPDVPMFVEAHVALADAVISTPASSFNGSTDVATVMSGFASKMNVGFENNGVDTKLSSPYFHGSCRDQAMACANHANIGWIIDNGTLAIWPKNGARSGTIPLISPTTGMVGYPAFIAQGIMVRTLYNPAIIPGGKIQVQSSLKPACGTWAVASLTYDLDTLVPNGNWFSTVGAYNPNFAPPVLGVVP